MPAPGARPPAGGRISSALTPGTSRMRRITGYAFRRISAAAASRPKHRARRARGNDILACGDEKNPNCRLRGRHVAVERRRGVDALIRERPRKERLAHVRSRIAAECSPIPPVKTRASRPPGRCGHRRDRRRKAVDEHAHGKRRGLISEAAARSTARVPSHRGARPSSPDSKFNAWSAASAVSP